MFEVIKSIEVINMTPLGDNPFPALDRFEANVKVVRRVPKTLWLRDQVDVYTYRGNQYGEWTDIHTGKAAPVDIQLLLVLRWEKLLTTLLRSSARYEALHAAAL